MVQAHPGGYDRNCLQGDLVHSSLINYFFSSFSLRIGLITTLKLWYGIAGRNKYEVYMLTGKYGRSEMNQAWIDSRRKKEALLTKLLPIADPGNGEQLLKEIKKHWEQVRPPQMNLEKLQRLMQSQVDVAEKLAWLKIWNGSSISKSVYGFPLKSIRGNASLDLWTSKQTFWWQVSLVERVLHEKVIFLDVVLMGACWFLNCTSVYSWAEKQGRSTQPWRNPKNLINDMEDPTIEDYIEGYRMLGMYGLYFREMPDQKCKPGGTIWRNSAWHQQPHGSVILHRVLFRLANYSQYYYCHPIDLGEVNDMLCWTVCLWFFRPLQIHQVYPHQDNRLQKLPKLWASWSSSVNSSLYSPEHIKEWKRPHREGGGGTWTSGMEPVCQTKRMIFIRLVRRNAGYCRMRTNPGEKIHLLTRDEYLAAEDVSRLINVSLKMEKGKGKKWFLKSIIWQPVSFFAWHKGSLQHEGSLSPRPAPTAQTKLFFAISSLPSIYRWPLFCVQCNHFCTQQKQSDRNWRLIYSWCCGLEPHMRQGREGSCWSTDPRWNILQSQDLILIYFHAQSFGHIWKQQQLKDISNMAGCKAKLQDLELCT